MKPSDLLIIYLACGAPLGVYYYLNNRNLFVLKKLLPRAIFNFIFWPPFLITFLKENKTFRKIFADKNVKRSVLNPDLDREIFQIQKSFEGFFKIGQLKMSIFEFREIFERYVGLTLALKNQGQKTPTKDEIFHLADHNDIELAKICLKRRNRKHLSFHQTNARQNFLNIVNELSFSNTDQKKLAEQAFEFVKLINDEKALPALAEIFDKNQQTQKDSTVKQAEEETWKTDTPKQLNANHLPIRFRTMPAMVVNLRKKD